MDFPSFSTLFGVGRAEALIRNPQLAKDAIDRDGSDANILVAAGAAVGDEVIGALVTVAAGLYLDSAAGEALDRLMADRYGLLRKTAAAGIGGARFTVGGANPAPFTIPIGTQLATPDGIKYETIDAVLFAKDATFAFAVIRSLQASASQQIKPNTLTNILSQIPNAPNTIAVTNPLATAGAADRESDTDFRARGRAFFSTARKGTISAITQGALSVPGVLTANVFEGVDVYGRPAPFVECVVSDQYTDALATLSTIPPAYAVQSQQLAQQVVSALYDYRPAGIFVSVRVAQVALQQITLALSFRAGAATVTVGNAARAVVVNYVNNLVPGAPLDPDDLLTVLGTVEGLIITGNEILTPTGEVLALPLQVLRTSMDLVAIRTADGL